MKPTFDFNKVELLKMKDENTNEVETFRLMIEMDKQS